MPFDGRDGGHVRARVPRRRQAFDSTAKRRYLALLGIGQSMCICGCSLSSAPAFAAHDDGVSSDSASRESPVVPARIRRHSRLHIPAMFSQQNHAEQLDAGRLRRKSEYRNPKFEFRDSCFEFSHRYAYIIKCDEVIKDPTGKVTELRCTADLDSKTGGATAGRKIKGTIHWVSAKDCIEAECRLYDRLFTAAEPDADGDFKKHLNSNSLEIVICKAEPSVKAATPEARYQFERLGYFALDPDSQPGKLVFNRTITLKDAWTKVERRGGQ
jgi:hypothetical protein